MAIDPTLNTNAPPHAGDGHFNGAPMKKLILTVLVLSLGTLAIAGCHARADVDDNHHVETGVGVAR